MLCRDADCFVQIRNIDQVITAEDFSRLGEWAIDDLLRAVANAHAFRRGGQLQRSGSQVLATLVEPMRELDGLGQGAFLRWPSGNSPGPFIVVAQQHVFHGQRYFSEDKSEAWPAD